jgi:tripartite ATP-independent transporter DctP family solute receptor
MKKGIVLVFCIIFIGGLLFAGGQKDAGPSTGEKKAVKLVYSTAAAPAAAHGKGAQILAEEAEKLSGGRIKIDVHLGGTLFTQEGQMSAIRQGTLDMTDGGPNWFEEQVPSLAMFSAAYIFKDYAHMTKVLNGDIGKNISEEVATKMGVRPLSSWYMGTRHLNLRDIGKEVKTPDDMRGIKLRMPNSPSWIAMGKALGANPTPISIPEVYLALKTGAVDAQDMPIPATLMRKFNEVTKYYVLTGHSVNPIMPVINEKKWQALSMEDRNILYRAAEKGKEYCDNENLKIEENGVKTLRERGVVVTEINKAVWMKYAQNYYMSSKELSGAWDLELFKKIAAMAD